MFHHGMKFYVHHCIKENARLLSCNLTLHRTIDTCLTNSVALVRERPIPTERPPLVGEVSANFCG
jgi:hypothetical protein